MPPGQYRAGFSVAPSRPKNHLGGGFTKCSLDWSRTARKKRKLDIAASDNQQTLITDYIEVLDEVHHLLKQNAHLSELLKKQLATRMSNTPALSAGSILDRITTAIKTNSGKNPKQRRHDENIKKFSTALYILCGSMAYEFIHKNLPQAMPSVRTIQSTIHSQYTHIEEGEFRFD